MAELNPLYRTLVGFDRIASLMDQAARLDTVPGYPPFNIEQTSEDAFRIELAVAGFGEDDLSIEYKQNSLIVAGASNLKRSAITSIAASPNAVLSAALASLTMCASPQPSLRTACSRLS